MTGVAGDSRGLRDGGGRSVPGDTHNKGIMNGVDAVVIATGNDWRAIEAGRMPMRPGSGRYARSSQWEIAPNGDLRGRWKCRWRWVPWAGRRGVHPSAQVALKILGVKTARELAEVIVAVGLAQNLAASAPWLPRASSAATWSCTPGRSRWLWALPVMRLTSCGAIGR